MAKVPMGWVLHSLSLGRFPANRDERRRWARGQLNRNELSQIRRERSVMTDAEWRSLYKHRMLVMLYGD